MNRKSNIPFFGAYQYQIFVKNTTEFSKLSVVSEYVPEARK